MGGEQVNVIRDTLTIERNGDGFMLRTARVLTQGSHQPTIYPEVKEPAIFKDGQLQVGGGLGVFVIDKKSGHLVSPEGGGDYTHVK